MNLFKKAMSLFLSFVMLLSLVFAALPVLADEVQTEQAHEFTLADGSTSNFTADTTAGTVVTDGTKNGYLYFAADTENGYATKWEVTGTVTKETNPYLSFGVRDRFGKTQWFLIYNWYMHLDRIFWNGTSSYEQDKVHVIGNLATTDFYQNKIDKLDYKIVVENDVLKAYFGNDSQEMMLTWDLPLTNATFGGFAPGSEYQLGITWVDPVVLNFSNMHVTAATKYTDADFHIADLSNAVADPANGTVVTSGVDEESNIYFSADENYNSYAKNWNFSGTISREAKENTNTFTAFAVQDTSGKTQWFCIVGKTLVRMRRWDWDESKRAAADNRTIFENQATSDYNWSNQNGARKLNFHIVVQNDTLKAYFGSDTQVMQLAWDLPLTEKLNGGFAAGSAYRLVVGHSISVKTTISNIRVHTENLVYTAKQMAQADQLSIRDPFVLVDNGTYYLYGTSGFGKLEVYTSSDLYMWTKQNPCFVAYGDFFGNAVVFSSAANKEKAFWAPEVYKVGDAYYMLATFTQDTETMNQQATVMLKANSPLGPFAMWSDGPITPAAHSCLDATLYFENGVPYLIYAHEWQCACRNYNGTGSMDYIQLSGDLKTTVGSSSQWFGANELTTFWDNILGTSSSRTTDGPFVYTDENGQNYLMWSTHLDPSNGNTYAQLATKFDGLGSALNLKNASSTLQQDNGGHGMIFTDVAGQKTLIMHNAENKAVMYNVGSSDKGITLENKTVSPNYLEGWMLSLKDNIGATFYMKLTPDQANSAEVEFVVDGRSTVVSGSEATVKDGLYGFSVEVSAVQMTRPITVKLSIGGVLLQEQTYTVRQYAEYILKDENNEYPTVTEDLVKAMLNYGAKAQEYFDYHVDELANKDYEISQFTAIPGDWETQIEPVGAVPGVSVYGATLLLKSKVGLRYYFIGDVSGCTFVEEGSGKILTPVQKDDLWYVDVEDVLPQDLNKSYTVSVSDGEGHALSVTYGPMYYMARKYANGTDALKTLLLSMYQYHLEACDYLNYTDTDGIVLIKDGYADTDCYAVMSANIQAGTALNYGWKNTVAIGVSGNVAWNNYAFQLAYGNSSEQNLVKLNNNKGYNGTDVLQEQWYNNAKLEKLFAAGGMDIKVVRMNTRAFLLADMGDGYELIGTMMVPADATTNFNIYNNDTEVQISNVSVETGKEATLAALNGIDLTLSKTPHIFPIDSESWTVEGRLSVDFNSLPTSDYRLFAGADGFSQAVAVLSVGGSATDWRVQNQKSWANYALADAYYNLLNKENGGMWVRWIRSGDILTLWVSSDGNNWQQTVSHTELTNDDLYILANQNLGAQLLDVTFSTDAVFTQQKKAGTMFIPADYTGANYAVFEANIKALDAITYDWASNLVISVSGDNKWDKYDFQILYGTGAERNCVKLTNNTAGTFDGITVAQTQNVNLPAFEKPFTEEGMNIKVVRLNTWVYLLADMGSGYEIVGKMYIPADQATRFGVYNNNTAITISNYSVTTGEAAALAALDGISLKVDQLANAFAFDVSTTQWTIEGKVSISDFAAGADYRFTVSSNKSEWKRMTLAYINNQSKWKGQSVAQASGSWASAEIPNGALLTGDGLWTRWVRDGGTLSLYISADGQTWTYVQNCDNCGSNPGIIYIFETNGDFSPIFEELTIRAGLPEVTAE